MRTYEELIPEFVGKITEDKQKWIDELSLEELKTFRDGLNRYGLNTFSKGNWIKYIDLVILKRIEEQRESKLNDLGII